MLVGGEQTRYLNFTIKGQRLYWSVFKDGEGEVYEKKSVYIYIYTYIMLFNRVPRHIVLIDPGCLKQSFCKREICFFTFSPICFNFNLS